MKQSGSRVILLTLTCMAAPAVAAADVVTDWNNAALAAIRAERTSPPHASRALAMLHVAIYDAVNGIERRFEPYFVREQPRGDSSRDAATAAAAHAVLAPMFPSQAASFAALRAAGLQSIKDGPRKQRGIDWGERVAAQILVWRAGDNADAIVGAPAGAGAGAWMPTPPGLAAFLLPQWGEVTPFAMPTNSHFRPQGPPALTSARYAEEYEEVRLYGAATGSRRTAVEDEIARFWADGAGTETPPGHWNRIAQDVAAARGTSVIENARLFALLNVAMADAGICAWEAKYTFNFWRPVTAIRQGGADGNPATTGDGAWTSFLVTPPFPDYVSGHSTFSGAAARILARFFGKDRTAFTTGSDFLPGVTRTFRSFSAAAGEASISRLYGGIHFRAAGDDGLAAGREIGDWTFRNFMQPIRNHARRPSNGRGAHEPGGDHQR